MQALNTKYLKNNEIELQLIEAKEEPIFGNALVYYFELLNCDQDKIGSIELRVGHTEELYYYGNIVCQIDPRYQGYHYGYKASKLLLELAKKHNMGYVSVTCDKMDVKCKVTCERLGMKLLEVAQIPAGHPLHQKGLTEVEIYVLDVLK